MRFKLQIDDTVHQVVAGAEGGLLIDMDRFETKVTRSGADRLVVQVGDKSYDVRMLEGDPEAREFVLELAGERIPVVVTDVSRGGAATARVVTPPVVAAHPVAQPESSTPVAHAGGEGIRAPMPGRIVDVLVEEGYIVEAGDVVLILEAMKMENELRAPRKGTVTSVLVKKGDPAEGGQLLIALE